MKYLLLEDKLGISFGYRETWTALRMRTGLIHHKEIRRSLWRSEHKDEELVIKKGNRTTPGFNPDERIAEAVDAWLEGEVLGHNIDAIMCMDLAMLGVVEPAWDIATIDNLRGGVYNYMGRPFLVTTPISATRFSKNTRDIKLMNDGADSLEEWLELNEDGDGYDVYIEPYVVKAGGWILQRDLEKFMRITERR